MCAGSRARSGACRNHAKRDSTGICFIGERPFREFLSRYLPKEPGPMATPEGERVGEHQGLMYYTIGQRQGPGHRRAARRRRRSVGTSRGKDLEANTLIVVQGHDHGLLLKRRLAAADASLDRGRHAARAGAFGAKTRYRQADSACELVPSGERAFELEFPRAAVGRGRRDNRPCSTGATNASAAESSTSPASSSRRRVAARAIRPRRATTGSSRPGGSPGTGTQARRARTAQAISPTIMGAALAVRHRARHGR